MSETAAQVRTPPHNLDAERAALGAALLDPQRFVVLQDLLKAEHFYSHAHQRIYLAMAALAEENQPIDPATLAESLRHRGDLETVGGPAYVATLESYVYSTDNLEQYARTLVDLARLRRLIVTAQQIQERAFSAPRPVAEILDEAEKEIFELGQESQHRDFVHVGEVAVDAISLIDQRFHNRQEVSGLPTGYDRLDKLLTGFHPSQLIILAARPAMGKTALALNIAANIIRRPGKPVGVFSLEMSAQEIVQRLLCGMARISMQKVRMGMFGRAELERLEENARTLSNMPLYIDDAAGLNAMELRAKARRLKAQVRDLGLLVVDYLQLMRGHGRAESRQQEVAEISRSLKTLARELETPVLALSQLSRGIEQRKNREKRPKLSDLRESGAIEQDADVVLFIHREDPPGQRGEGDGPQMPFLPAEVIVGKQRNGPPGSVPLLFFGEFVRFESPADDVGL